MLSETSCFPERLTDDPGLFRINLKLIKRFGSVPVAGLGTGSSVMSDNSKIVFAGGAGIALGVAIGMLFGGPDVGGIEEQVDAASSEIASISGKLNELSDRLASVEGSLANETALTGEDLANAVRELSENTVKSSLDQASQLSDNLRTAISEAATEQTEKLRTAISEADTGQLAELLATLEAKNSELVDRIHERLGAIGGGEAPSTEAAPQSDTQLDIEEDTTEIIDTGTGGPVIARTVVLNDGDIRVYIAGYLDHDDAVMIAVNGYDVQTVRKGRSTQVQVGDKTCNVKFVGIEDREIKLEAECS